MKKELFEKNWQKWRKGELQIHFIHTGVAESILFIFPDGTTRPHPLAIRCAGGAGAGTAGGGLDCPLCLAGSAGKCRYA